MALLWGLGGFVVLVVASSLIGAFVVGPGRELGGGPVDAQGRFAFDYASPKPARLFLRMRVEYDGTGDARDMVVAWRVGGAAEDAVQLGLLPSPKARPAPGRVYRSSQSRLPGNVVRMRGIELLARELPAGERVSVSGHVKAGPNTRIGELRAFVAS